MDDMSTAFSEKNTGFSYLAVPKSSPPRKSLRFLWAISTLPTYGLPGPELVDLGMLILPLALYFSLTKHKTHFKLLIF